MMHRVRGQLTYANVVATLALFIALSGATAFAATQLAKNSVGPKQLRKNAVTTAKIKNGAITGAKINASSLGPVPSAASADNASALGGAAPSAYARTQLEPIHFIGDPGEPAFQSGCTDINPSLFGRAGYYKDGFGIVRLVGVLSCASASAAPVFTLPPGFRPATAYNFIVTQGATDPATLQVLPNGEVRTFSFSPTLVVASFRTG
jgi:hypothetical protein